MPTSMHILLIGIKIQVVKEEENEITTCITSLMQTLIFISKKEKSPKGSCNTQIIERYYYALG